MEAGQYATLNKDVGFKKVVYSKKGTKVKIISISGNAVIYETENGNYNERYKEVFYFTLRYIGCVR